MGSEEAGAQHFNLLPLRHSVLDEMTGGFSGAVCPRGLLQTMETLKQTQCWKRRGDGEGCEQETVPGPRSGVTGSGKGEQGLADGASGVEIGPHCLAQGRGPQARWRDWG